MWEWAQPAHFTHSRTHSLSSKSLLNEHTHSAPLLRTAARSLHTPPRSQSSPVQNTATYRHASGWWTDSSVCSLCAKRCVRACARVGGWICGIEAVFFSRGACARVFGDQEFFAVCSSSFAMSNIVACLRHYGLAGTVRRLFHMKGDIKVGRLVGVDQVRGWFACCGLFFFFFPFLLLCFSFFVLFFFIRNMISLTSSYVFGFSAGVCAHLCLVFWLVSYAAWKSLLRRQHPAVRSAPLGRVRWAPVELGRRGYLGRCRLAWLAAPHD